MGGHGKVFDDAFSEFDVGQTGEGYIFACFFEHGVGHIDTDDLAMRADFFGGEQQVDARAGAEVEHALSFFDFGKSQGVTAAEGIDDGLSGKARDLLVGIAGEFGDDTFGGWRAATRFRRFFNGLRIVFRHVLPDFIVIVRHGGNPSLVIV